MRIGETSKGNSTDMWTYSVEYGEPIAVEGFDVRATDGEIVQDR